MAKCGHSASIQIFAFESEISENRKLVRGRKNRVSTRPFDEKGTAYLEPYKDAAANRRPGGIHPKRAFFTEYTTLEIENVSRIHDRLRPERHAECRQALRDQDAQARVVNCQSSLKGIDSEYGRLRRKPEDRFDIRSAVEVGLQLCKEGAESGLFEKLARLRDRFLRYALALAETVTGGGGQLTIDPPGVNKTHPAGTALLFARELGKIAAVRIERCEREADAAAENRIHKNVCLDA